MSLVTALKSVVLISDDPDRTAAFYRDVLGLPLEAEAHRGTRRHHAGQVGDQHWAIHPREGFWVTTAAQAGAPDTVVSLTVPDLAAMEAQLTEHGVPVIARNRIGPMSFLAVHDPDGRVVCFGTPWGAGTP